MKRTLSFAATVLVFGVAAMGRLEHHPLRFELPPPSEAVARPPVHEAHAVSSGLTPAVHSASAVELGDGRLRAFWYGGTREGARDVSIRSALFDGERWSRETVVATRADTERGLLRVVKKLGNPVASRDRDGRLWLFYVTVSVGGWSGSSVTVRTSDDDGMSFGPPHRLVTSPFLNISTLVRGPVVRYQDGSQGLPVYHELIGKFGELVRLDADGRVMDKARLSAGRTSLQPVVVPFSPTRGVALLRASGSSPKRVLAVETRSAGFDWGTVRTTPLSNPDAAVAALRLSSGDWLLAFNDSEVDRSNLSLALSENNGDSWETVSVVEAPDLTVEAPRFAYPWLVEGSDGTIHLLYTWDRRQIRHERFNRDWLLSRR